jgi:hypothetical protein
LDYPVEVAVPYAIEIIVCTYREIKHALSRYYMY